MTSELRKDPIVGRWIIVEQAHPYSPKDYGCETHTQENFSNCPFCYGNEAKTPHEIDSIREGQTQSNSPGWQARVVPNKYPALKIEGNIDKKGIGIYDMSNGVGAHEILIETPYHNKDIPDLLNGEIEKIISMYCRRTQDLIKDKRFKYIMIFKNYGPQAGASLEHPHTQIIALPMVPKNALEELHGATEYLGFRGRCIYCDILRQELEEKERVIRENEYFVSFCPFACRFPFEIWILPKRHCGQLYHSRAEEIPALAAILKETIACVKNIFGNLCYNYIIHSSPSNGDSESSSYHWHIEFMPKLTRVAGFEWGSGFYVVLTPPELAAKFLRHEIQ